MKLFAAACLWALASLPALAAPVHTRQFLSKVYTIDRKYRSMEGPSSVQRIVLGESSRPELLWITGIRTEMVGADGSSPQLPELMCHVNVDLDAAKHQALFDFQRATATRLMTLSQGMLQAKLPAGYGFPIASNEPLLLFTQVLNHNIEHPNGMQVRHKVTFEYVRDAELTSPMKALFNVGASGMVQLEGNPMALASMMPTARDGAVEGEHTGASCIVGARAPQAVSSAADYKDPAGRKMTGHWIVPPGRQTNESDITWFMQLPYDTRVHYAAFHLHPYAESLSIRDVTTGQTVMMAHARNPAEGVGLTHVDTFTSVPGTMLYKAHKYDLVSVYNNTSRFNADSMASVFLGLDDPEFVHLAPEEFARRAAAILDANTVTIHTTAGDLVAQLMRAVAPMTSVQVARLVYDGAFSRARAMAVHSEMRIATPADRVARLLQPVGEHGGAFDRGSIIYCSSAEEVSLRFISNAAAPHEGGCIAFGRVIDGMEIVDALARTPSAVAASVKSATLGR